MFNSKSGSFINKQVLRQTDHSFKVSDSGSFIVNVQLVKAANETIAAHENCDVISAKESKVAVRINDITKNFKLSKGNTKLERAIYTYRLDGTSPKEV